MNEVRTDIIKALNPGGVEETKDGMDCILIALDLKNKTLEYSSANNSFYIIRNNTLILCPADKMAVGKSPKDHEVFTYNKILLEPGDYIYTLTDGLPDQFGGPKGKKFKYKQLEGLLLDTSSLPADEQKAKLETAFEEWKGNLEQVDDVLLIGIKI